MGELLPSRHRQQGVSGTRQLYSDAVAPVVAVQAQNQATQGRDLSTPASLRALRARTSEQAWARRAVGEGVKSCPRAGSVLSTQCLDRRIPDKQILTSEVNAWQANRNKHHAKADWQFTTPDARIKLKRLYPQFE